MTEQQLMDLKSKANDIVMKRPATADKKIITQQPPQFPSDNNKTERPVLTQENLKRLEGPE